MCFNCGCGVPHDDMGHPDNITNHTFQHLGEHWKMDELAAKKKVLSALEGREAENEDMKAMFTKAAGAWGQPEDEARKETLKLLQKELES